MAIVIKKPTAPMMSKPMAVTLDIVLNSSILGFFNSRQTRLYCVYSDVIFCVSVIVFSKKTEFLSLFLCFKEFYT